MTCKPCARAADNRAPREAHCTDPACTCAHRTKDYGNVTARIAATTGPPPTTLTP